MIIKELDLSDIGTGTCLKKDEKREPNNFLFFFWL